MIAMVNPTALPLMNKRWLPRSVVNWCEAASSCARRWKRAVLSLPRRGVYPKSGANVDGDRPRGEGFCHADRIPGGGPHDPASPADGLTIGSPVEKLF